MDHRAEMVKEITKNCQKECCVRFDGSKHIDAKTASFPLYNKKGDRIHLEKMTFYYFTCLSCDIYKRWAITITDNDKSMKIQELK